MGGEIVSERLRLRINVRNKLHSLAHSHPSYSWSARQDKENMGGLRDKGGLKQKDALCTAGKIILQTTSFTQGRDKKILKVLKDLSM